MNSGCGRSFELSQGFVQKFADVQPDFGFKGLGELVFRRTYSRVTETGVRERWFETCQRVVDGTFSMQQAWMAQQRLPWDAGRARLDAEDMYRRMFEMKFLPPGRGLWAMGSTLTADRGCFAALHNCSFVSTRNIAQYGASPFAMAMSQSMLGIGVGFDVTGAGDILIKAPGPGAVHLVADSREGWVHSLEVLLEAFFHGATMPQFDYSGVRPAGTVIRGFGGSSQGPDPLKQLHRDVTVTLGALIGRPITTTAIVDIFNQIGCCIVSGSVRRSAEIAVGDYDDAEFLDLKDNTKNPHRAAFSWASNNSVKSPIGADYEAIAERMRLNGEPGIIWLENAREFGRMRDGANALDYRVCGCNPCAEQTLEDCELCCLVEVFPARADDYDDFERTLECALLYAKTVTLGATEWPEVNEVLLRNRRVGLSLTGIAQFVAARDIESLRQWCEEGYRVVRSTDAKLSERFAVPRSIKLTSVKPSGTVSLLAGATPGVHFPDSRFYLRRVRMAKDSDLLAPLETAGYPIEDCAMGTRNTVVVSFPIDAGEGVKTLEDATMWEQLAMAAFMQRYWADNAVSVTVTFSTTESAHIATALNFYQYQLKAVSFLPRLEGGVYKQMPYEKMSEAEFRELSAGIKALDFGTRSTTAHQVAAEEEDFGEQFCSSEICMRL
ncbi:hypothetical protein JKP88DRAFT_157690 [Tribonema minus]|uniref:ribonucleoside-triphosphate reductase (thioredoxin) n=1 Tax=Tribonema minus TaxID=303371 RepID=A0A835YWJ8_9STRA|nr:hypothetical protein JKP88DRAFT_157690 [Tribonema minus]